MTAPFLGLFLACLVGLLVVAVYEWVAVLLLGYRLACRFLGPRAPAPDTSPIAEVGGGCQPQAAKRPPTEEGVDNRRSGGYVPLVALPLGTAMQPDFESFFGGFQAAIEGAGIALIAVGMVLIARRYLRP